MARSVRIDRAEPLLQKAPIDRERQLRQRMLQIDDLISRAMNRSFWPLSRRSLGRIETPSTEPVEEENHAQSRRSICKKSS
jgi:hypothetical protein